jgi:dynein heavy chain 1
MVLNVSKYLQEWYQYQVLWDLEPSHLVNQLGANLDEWINLLQDFKKSRSIFDTSNASIAFDGIVINFALIQAKVSAQYDFWQRDLAFRFGCILGTSISNYFTMIMNARARLEEISWTGRVSDIVNNLIYLEEAKSKHSEWKLAVEVIHNGQKILEKCRFHYPTTWVYSEQVKGEWSSFEDILAKKQSGMNDQLCLRV